MGYCRSRCTSGDKVGPMAVPYNDKQPLCSEHERVEVFDDTTISANVWKHETSKLYSCVDELIFSWMNLNVNNCLLPFLDPSGYFHLLTLTVSQ